MNNRLNGTDKPLSLATEHAPPRAGPEMYILRLKGSERYTFTIYSKALWGVWVHWYGEKSAPHYTDESRCPGCRANSPKRWKGFLHAYCHEKKQEVFLELTPASAASMLDQVVNGEPLRGLGAAVQRTKGDNGRLLIRLVKSAQADPDKLPPEKDPQESLMRLWGLGDPGDPGGKEFPVSANGFFHH